jgi:hypothetical protein
VDAVHAGQLILLQATIRSGGAAGMSSRQAT